MRRLIRGSSTGSTSVAFLRFLFRFCDFFVRMWLWNAFFRFNRPDAVVLKRFLAPLFDFILGMRSQKTGLYREFRDAPKSCV